MQGTSMYLRTRSSVHDKLVFDLAAVVPAELTHQSFTERIREASHEDLVREELLALDNEREIAADRTANHFTQLCCDGNVIFCKLLRVMSFN
jgi:hypothetical protein